MNITSEFVCLLTLTAFSALFALLQRHCVATRRELSYIISRYATFMVSAAAQSCWWCQQRVWFR